MEKLSIQCTNLIGNNFPTLFKCLNYFYGEFIQLEEEYEEAQRDGFYAFDLNDLAGELPTIEATLAALPPAKLKTFCVGTRKERVAITARSPALAQANKLLRECWRNVKGLADDTHLPTETQVNNAKPLIINKTQYPQLVVLFNLFDKTNTQEYIADKYFVSIFNDDLPDIEKALAPLTPEELVLFANEKLDLDHHSDLILACEFIDGWREEGMGSVTPSNAMG